jgi:hypothetical protein
LENSGPEKTSSEHSCGKLSGLENSHDDYGDQENNSVEIIGVENTFSITLMGRTVMFRITVLKAAQGISLVENSSKENCTYSGEQP